VSGKNSSVLAEFIEAFIEGYLLRMWRKIFVQNLAKSGGHFAGKRYNECFLFASSNNHAKTESSNFSALVQGSGEVLVKARDIKSRR